jgi:phosphoadenosine phosphosulfate reductase
MNNNPTLPGIDLSLEAYTQDAIRLLRACQPSDKPYYGCFSGGKDSCVIKELAKMAGVNVIWHYNVTTIDPPELVHFIRREHPDVILERPKENFFTYAIKHKKGFPTRRTRWCCEVYKERTSPKGSFLLMGMRAAESPRRAKAWQSVSFHRTTQSTVLCPIIGFSDEQVWDFIESLNLPYCELYDQGFDRIGCIGCPMARKSGRLAEFARWPGFDKKWKQLFKNVWDARTGSTQRDGQIWFGDRYFKNWEEMWEWWLSDEPLPTDECQGLKELFV